MRSIAIVLLFAFGFNGWAADVTLSAGQSISVNKLAGFQNVVCSAPSQLPICTLCTNRNSNANFFVAADSCSEAGAPVSEMITSPHNIAPALKDLHESGICQGFRDGGLVDQ